MKKIIAWVLTVVLTATAAIGGTMAYLTDRDSEANVFTVGNVDISLEENFEQDSELIPGVDINKDVQIKNEGPNAAWVWYTYAIPKALDTANDASANVLHVNHAGANWLGYQDNQAYWAEGQTEATPETKCWIPDYNPAGNGAPIGEMTVGEGEDAVVYNVYAVLYNGVLPAGETTTVGMTKVYLDAAVDIDPDGQLHKVVDGVATEIDWNINNDAHKTPVIFVNAYAMQTEGFGTVQEAYEAFADQWGGMIEAGTYETAAEPWTGETDTSWYNETDTEFVITTPEQLAGLAKLVDDGNTFAGKTVKLGADINLGAVDAEGNKVKFEPIGDASNADFSGTFDGQNHTIFNLYQDCNSKHLGLFGAVYEGTIKNLTLDGARIENDGSGYAGAIASYTGASNFDNITLKNTTVANYNHNTAGIAAWVSNNGTTTTFENINIEDTTTIASWWGSYDTRVGGIVGAMNTGNNVVIKNSTVACRLDVYNDVCSNYQWYNYRMAGMVVADVRDTKTVDGRTEANPARVTCENVTVIFGDWADYHYCEFESNGKPSYASEGEWKYSRVEAGEGYGGVDITACNHDTDEEHNVLISFDGLFGARDGKGIYTINSFDGVTVVNNK